MELQKVILYYGFVPLADPEAVRLWQHLLCTSLNLKGRILISEHGINGTLGGNMGDLKKYVKATKLYPGMNKIDFKWSEGYVGVFSKLSVRVRDEIVSFGAPGELKVSNRGVVNGGVHLKPEQVNQLVADRGDDVVFFDGRNAYEAAIGRFKNAIVPDVETTRDFVAEIESGKYDHLKDKPIVTYCTGGIRCEILSSVMINRGFNEVYQIKGGIVRYGEKYGEKGLWEGSLYVFDNRMNMNFSENTTLLGTCERCATPTNTYKDCGNSACRKLTLLCESCLKLNSPESCHHDTAVKRHESTVG